MLSWAAHGSGQGMVHTAFVQRITPAECSAFLPPVSLAFPTMATPPFLQPHIAIFGENATS